MQHKCIQARKEARTHALPGQHHTSDCASRFGCQALQNWLTLRLLSSRMRVSSSCVRRRSACSLRFFSRRAALSASNWLSTYTHACTLTACHALTCVHVGLYAVLWRGMAWHGMAWHGMAWHGWFTCAQSHAMPCMCMRLTACAFACNHMPRHARTCNLQHLHACWPVSH